MMRMELYPSVLQMSLTLLLISFLAQIFDLSVQFTDSYQPFKSTIQSFVNNTNTNEDLVQIENNIPQYCYLTLAWGSIFTSHKYANISM